MSDPVELLFFDTFSHENSEELNLDLVQFTKPVYISEVRVIPLGARVQADFPGGVRLGATNPSQFTIEFFVNDLGKPGASTFESLGGLDYNQNGCIHLECASSDLTKRQIPTDGLVLRGWYTTITLAVYGTLTRGITEPIPVPAPPPVVPPQATVVPTDVQQQMVTPTSVAQDQTWITSDVNISNTPMDYNPSVPVAAYGPPPNYSQPEVYSQEYSEYYNNDPPKDPRAYHHSEPEWDSGKTRSLSTENRSDTHSRRDRIYSRSHSRDRDYRENSRDSSDYESRIRDRSNSIEYRDKDWDRYSKHQDTYKRNRDHSYEREDRKRPRTPPISSSKRPHTPHGDVKDLSPGDVESISEEEIVGGESEPIKFKHNETTKESDMSPVSKISDDHKNRIQGEDVKTTPSESPNTQNEESAGLLDVEEFEPILSDEDICDEGEQFQDLDYDYSEYVNNDDLIKLFNPFSADVQHYTKPSLLTEIKDFFILKPEDEDVVSRMEGSIISKLNVLFKDKSEMFSSLSNLLALNVNMRQHFENEGNISGEIKEEWVQLCDQIPSLLENNELIQFIINLYLYLTSRNSKDADFIEKNNNYIEGKAVLMTLLDWVKIGLNFEYALSQVQPGYKIRHIKCGIRLVEAICRVDGTELLTKDDYDVQLKLIELYHKEYMALSIKLMILKALDATLWSKHGIEYFIKTKRKFGESFLNGYQIIIEMLKANPLVRVKFALNSVITKLNNYEILKSISDTISNWLLNKYLENEYCCNAIPEKEMEDLSFLLYNISKTYRFGSFSITQPKRFLPVSAQFEINRNINEKNVCYTLFEFCNFLENCLVLLTHRTCNNMAIITSSILEILCEMLNHQDGLRYLSENIETINMIIRCLLHSSNSEDDAQFSRAQRVGLEISYKLQALYHVESLFYLARKYSFDYDATEVLDQLHSFYCLTFSNVGKTSVADVLSTSNNLYCVLQFFDEINFDSKQEKDDAHIIKLKKSPGMGYIIDLISVTLIFANNVSYLETYGSRLLKIANHYDLFEPSTCNKLQEIRLYVKPFEIKNIISYEDITPLCEIIKNSVPNVTKMPEELITCLRILVHLGIPPISDDAENQIEYTELKYKYVILQLYSLDGVSNLSAILQKVCEFYEQPNVHSSQLVAMQGAIIVNVVYPCVLLIRKMITNVIAVRNIYFKDLTTIPMLLQTFTLMHAYPTTSILYQKSSQVCQEIIEILLAYTQPVSEEVNENESLSKSLWTQMLSEILKYITSAPFTFIPGLLIFSELLPLPFPILTKMPLMETEITRAVNLRKLWSAHLHSQSTNIQDLINTLMASSYQPLLHLLRRVCIQLSDLAANSALMISRGILENVFNVLNPKVDKMEPCNGHAARILNFLASILTHGAIKCAVMYLLRTNPTNSIVKGDEKFPLLVGLFCDVLKIQSELPSHVQAQECVVSIIQSLCDSEITLYHNIESKQETSDIYLSNALPPRDMLQSFINTMIDHIMTPESSYTTILPIVRTFVLLTEHDYGFYHLQCCIEKKNKPFYNVFAKFTRNFSKDNADCLATLSAMLEFLRICLSTDYMEVEPDIMFTPRSNTMSATTVSASLGWSTVKTENQENGDNTKHPIVVLEKLLQDTISEDESLESLADNLAGLLKSLNIFTVEKAEPFTEPLMLPPESLLVQFNGRAIFSITNDISEERMSTTYWLSAPSDENDTDQEQIPCDLTELCRQLLPPEINLCRESERICQVSSCSEQITNDQLKIKRTSLDQHRYMTAADKLKRPFVTPMRGRGFLRTPPQRGDPFRSRPPNTSRPPSLHVDDFVALETCGAQPTGPTGYNKLSREIMSVRGASRGRGRAFVSPERGSHFRQVGRGTSIWPGALTETSVVTTLPQHFRVTSETATHFSTVRTTIRGRGIPRLREAIPVVRHVRTFPR